jgi:ATP-dependent DNA helicase RecG
LREPHGSVARNARICEALFLARYIEKYGTGTLMMIRESIEHSLPEPDFGQRAGEFTATVWRDWLTEAVLAASDLNDRQSLVIAHIKETGRVTSQEHRQLTGATPRTATRDLDDLVGKGLLRKVGTVGRGAHYAIQGKPDRKQTNRPSPAAGMESDTNRTNRTAPRRRKGDAGK